MTKNEKISKSLKEYYSKNVHSCKGKPGRKHTEQEKENLRKKSIETADRKGRIPESRKKAKNKAGVYAWRARKYNAIVESSDLLLIKKIYELCPEGYHVDHIISLSKGGLHHQDNLQYLPSRENCRKGSDRKYDQTLAISWKETIPEW